MDVIIKYTFLFSMGSLIGWCIELLYRHFASNPKVNGKRKWINPGFLTGPYLPLYGFCSCILYLLSEVEGYLPIDNDILRKFLVLLIMAVFITLIEYIAGIIFIKGMKVQLWDYSNNRGNIQGIICPLYSFFWLILSTAYYFGIYPYVIKSVDWLFNNLIFSFFIGMFMGTFLIDFVQSANIMMKIKKFADENEIVIIYEEFKENIRSRADGQINKIKAFFGKKSHITIGNQLKKYLQDSINKISIGKDKKD